MPAASGEGWYERLLTHYLSHLLAPPEHGGDILVTKQDLMPVVLGSSHFSCSDIYIFIDLSFKNKLTSGNTHISRGNLESRAQRSWMAPPDGTTVTAERASHFRGITEKGKRARRDGKMSPFSRKEKESGNDRLGSLEGTPSIF